MTYKNIKYKNINIRTSSEVMYKNLFKTQKEPTVNETGNEDSQEIPNSPIAKTPASASQKAFNQFFDNDCLFNKEDMQHETLKLNFTIF